MPPRGRKTEEEAPKKADTGLWSELKAIQAQCEAKLSTEEDYNRKIALTKINAALKYGLDLIGG